MKKEGRNTLHPSSLILFPMASIGNITFFRLIGNLPVPKMRLAVWTVPGINGYGVQQLGYQDQGFEVAAVGYGARVDAITFKDQLCALQGQTVTIIDDLGDKTDNCVIVEVGQPLMQAALAVGGVQQRCEVPIRGVIRA
jgi:hypothetical protein